MRQYGPKPGFGPYFIRALSPTEQLASKNEGYFLIGVSRVDFENKILKMKFLFSRRILGGFWYPPDPRVSRSARRTPRIREQMTHSYSCFSHEIRFFYLK